MIYYRPVRKVNGMNDKDIIYRQAAIDIAMQYCPDDDGSCSKGDRDIRELLDDLEDLPPAQPEIDRCKNCKNWDDDWGCDMCGEIVTDCDEDMRGEGEKDG